MIPVRRRGRGMRVFVWRLGPGGDGGESTFQQQHGDGRSGSHDSTSWASSRAEVAPGSPLALEILVQRVEHGTPNAQPRVIVLVAHGDPRDQVVDAGRLR